MTITSVKVTKDTISVSRLAKGSEWMLTDPTCVGTIQKGKMLYKEFPRSRFMIERSEITETITNHRRGNDVILIGVSGYSNLDVDRCKDLNIRQGAYEAAVVSTIRATIRSLRKELKQPDVRVVYGTSAMGVDASLETVCERENCQLLGTTCPEYLWHVSNNETGPLVCVGTDDNTLSNEGVVVTDTKDAYCHLYIQALDILFAANGGEVSYEMDILAGTKYKRRVVALDILRTLGARVQGFNHDRTVVLDAVAALQETFFGLEFSSRSTESSQGDSFAHLQQSITRQVVGLARNMVSPQRAYGMDE